MSKRIKTIWLLATGLCACNVNLPVTTDTAKLTSKQLNATPAQPSCSSCHAYPLHDVNHAWHLSSTTVLNDNLGRPELNAAITCMDCHFNSIQHFHYTHADTIWKDVNGDTLFQHTSPTDQIAKIITYNSYRPVPSSTTDTLHTYGTKDTTQAGVPDSLRTLGTVDTLQGILLGNEVDTLISRYAAVSQLVSWRTAWAHSNGKVDVSFPPNNLTGALPESTVYNPKDFSCSAVACHSQGDAKYRWMSTVRGLTGCPSLTGGDTTCNNGVAQ